MTTTNLRACIYTRVSKEEQLEGYSIEAQQEACRKLCADRGWVISLDLVEPGESAKNFEQRERWQEVMQAARAGRFDVLVTHKIDRFSRSTILDSLRALEDLRGYGVSFVSASEPIDFTSSVGEVLLVLFLWFARNYLTNLSAEVTKGRHGRAQSGRSNANRPPFGYKRIKSGDDVPDPKTRRWAIAMFQRYITGKYGDGQIAHWLNEQGARTLDGNLFTAQAVRELLINPFYAGWVRYRGIREPLTNKRTKRRDTRLIRGLHEPLITQATFDRAQAIRKTRDTRGGKPVIPSRVYLLQGLARCAHCGGRMKCSCSMSGKLRYNCAAGDRMIDCVASGRTVREEVLMPQIELMIAALQIPKSVIARAAELAESGEHAEQTQLRRAEIIAEMKRLDYLFQMGRKVQAEYDRESARLEAELLLLEPEPSPATQIEDAGSAFDDLLDAWRAANDDRAGRQEVLQSLLESVRVDALTATITQWQPLPEFAALFNTALGRS